MVTFMFVLVMEFYGDRDFMDFSGVSPRIVYYVFVSKGEKPHNGDVE